MKSVLWGVVCSLGLSACGGQESLCIATVDDVYDEGVTSDPAFNNSNLVGTTICLATKVGASYCKEQGGDPVNADDWPEPAEYCQAEGFTVDCGSGVWLKESDTCVSQSDTGG